VIAMPPELLNLLFPVSGLVVYPGGIVIKRSCNLIQLGGRHAHIRAEVTMLSKRSLNRLALLVRSSGIKWRSVWTLTYGVNYPMSGKVAKRNLNAFLVATRREFGPYDYFWVLEFQHRGAVHFHIATTLGEPDIFQRANFARIWARIAQPEDWSYCTWPLNPKSRSPSRVLSTRQAVEHVHGHQKAWEIVREHDGMSRYLAKYANKLRQKEVPVWYRNVGRFWGTSKGVKLPEGQEFDTQEAHARQLLWLKGRNTDKWEVLPKIVLC